MLLGLRGVGLVRWSNDVDNLRNPSPNCAGFVMWEDVSERFVGREDLSGVRRNDRVGIPAVYAGGQVPVEQVDTAFSGEVGERHIVEDDSVVESSVELPKLVHGSNQERGVKEVTGELGFACAGKSPNEQDSPVRAHLEGPDCGLILSGDLVY